MPNILLMRLGQEAMGTTLLMLMFRTECWWDFPTKGLEHPYYTAYLSLRVQIFQPVAVQIPRPDAGAHVPKSKEFMGWDQYLP